MERAGLLRARGCGRARHARAPDRRDRPLGSRARRVAAPATAGAPLHRSRRRDHLHRPPRAALGFPARLLCRASLSRSRLGPRGPRRAALLGPGGLQEAERSSPLSLAPGQRLRVPRTAELSHLLDRTDRRVDQQRVPPGTSGAAPPRHSRALDHRSRLLLCGRRRRRTRRTGKSRQHRRFLVTHSARHRAESHFRGP